MSNSMSNENNSQILSETTPFATIEQALDDIRNGKFVIVADDEARENEGDLICAAEKITPEMMNFMMGQARGMVCVALSQERAAELKLHQMVDENTDPNQTAYTISVDAGFEFGVTTGVSAIDRAITVQRLATPNATALDFRRPGHMFPITAKKGGVFRRIGHTEAALDLTRLAGVSPMGVMCEILNDDGSMARRDDLAAFAAKHGLSFVTVAQLIQYRLEKERSVTRQVSREIETRFGTFTAIGYKDSLDGCEHLALVKGPIENLANTVPYVRLQHEDVLHDLMTKADEEAHEIAQSMKIIQQQESGVLIYLRHQDDSVHGVLGALKTYQKPDAVLPNHQGAKNDQREYGAGAQILSDLGVGKFNMLSHSKKKIVALHGYGLEVVNTVPLTSEFDYTLPPKIELPSSIAVFVEEPSIAEVITQDDVIAPVVAETVVEPVVETETFTAPVVQQEEQIVDVAQADVQPEAQQDEQVDVQADIQAEEEEEFIPVMPTLASVASLHTMPKPVVQDNQQQAAAEAAPQEVAKETPVETVTHILPERTESKPMPELKAEPRFATMRMGGQVMSGQALFEG